jgi:hypothetical protein
MGLPPIVRHGPRPELATRNPGRGAAKGRHHFEIDAAVSIRGQCPAERAGLALRSVETFDANMPGPWQTGGNALMVLAQAFSATGSMDGSS